MAGNINVVVISGNTTRDVELRRTQAGMPIASFGMAVNDRRRDPQTGEWSDYANFIDVSGFGERWEKLAQYIPKGTKLTVHGKLRYSSWQTNDGQKRSKVEVIAEDVELPPRSAQNGSQGGYQQQAGGYNPNGYGAPQNAPQQPQAGYQQPQQQYQQQAQPMPQQAPASSVYDEDIPF